MEISLDITDEIATWPLKDTLLLLNFLEKNGFNEIYFDGYNAAIYILKVQK